MKSERLLSILLILMSRGRVTGKELAEHFEVSLRTIYRDIDEISRTIVPIYAESGKGGGYRIMEGYELDKSLLTQRDVKPLVSVMKGLKTVLGRNDSFNNTILKFEALYDKHDDGYDEMVINMVKSGEEEAVRKALDTIRAAIDDNRCLIFEYINRKFEQEERIVEPVQLEFTNGQWHLSAFCRNRKDYRSFKLDRMKDIKLGEAFESRKISTEELDKIFTEGYVNKSIKVVLKFSERMRHQLTEHFRPSRIIYTDDGYSLVEVLSPNEEGLKKYILSFGLDCEVIEPVWLRNELREYAGKICEMYGENNT